MRRVKKRKRLTKCKSFTNNLVKGEAEVEI
jgi:hypothetical protein